MVIPINKRKVDTINNVINPAPVVEPINPVSNGPITEIKPTDTFTQNQNRQKELEGLIKSGQGSASVNAEYNRLTGNQQGARDVMLGSTEAQKTMKTTITPEEAGFISQSGVKDIGEGVKPDMTAGTKEEFKQAITKQEKQTPTTTTDITYQEDKTPYDANKVISKAPQFTGADGKIYQTVRNSDNTLTTIDVTTGQPVTGKYTDAERDSIKQGFLKSPEQVQKETQQNIQLDPNNLFNQIRSGLVPTKDIQNTDEYKKSKQRADNLGRFENMSAKDLSYAINNGDLLPGTQTYNDLKTTRPDLVAEAEKLNALNSALTTTEKSNTDVLTKISEQIFKIFNGDTTTLKTKLSENPEVVKLNTDMATKKNELDSLKYSINNSYRDIEKELSGTGATKGYIQALASRRTEDLTRDYNTKLNEYNTMAGQLQTITEMVGYELEQEEKLQAKQLQALQFAYGIAKDETDYQRSLQAEQRQREYQQAQDIQNFEQQKEMLALQQEYQDRNIQTDMIQVGNKNVLINRKTGETIKSFDLPTENQTTQYGFSNVGDGTIAVTDPSTGKVTFQNSKGQTVKATPTDLISTPDGTILDSRLSSTTNPNGGKECGEFVNDITGIGLGDTLQSKLNKMETKATNSYEAIPANIGDVAVWVPDPTNKAFAKYGHAGIIIGEEGNNWIIKSSNIKGDGAVSTDKVPKQTIMGVSGKYDKSKLQGGPTAGGESNVGFNPDYVTDYAKYNNQKMTSADWKNISNPEQFKKEATAYGKSKDNEALPSIEQLIQDLEYLKTNANSRWQVPTGYGDYTAIYNNIIAKTALNNLIDLKSQGATFGALSNQELKFIGNASDSGRIAVTQTNDAYNKNLDLLIQNAKNMYKKTSGVDYNNNIGNTQQSTQQDPLGLFGN